MYNIDLLPTHYDKIIHIVVSYSCDCNNLVDVKNKPCEKWQKGM